MISKYKQFKEDLILENVINESIVYFTPKLTKILNLVRSDISNELLDIQGEDIKADVTLVDIGEEGYLSFTTMRNAIKNIAKEYPNLVDGNKEKDISIKPNTDLVNSLYVASPAIFTQSRNPVKIGRLIKTLLPGKFNDKEIETFVNKFKAVAYDKGEVFRIVSNDEIATWYSSLMYKDDYGTLGSSCMRNSSKSIFQLYVDNPGVCRLLILVDDNKLIGRALIWKVTGIADCEYFMDRQYTSNDKYVETFRNYAIEKGWAYKSTNNHYSVEDIHFNGKDINIEMSVQLVEQKYKRYPYMDTFKSYDPENHILTNKNDGEIGHYLLQDTDGGYNVINDPEDEVYSDYYGETISRDEAIWSEVLNTWLNSESSSRVDVGRNAGVYPDGYDDIVYDEYKGRDLHIDDCIFSDKYEHFILESESVRYITSVSDDGSLEDDYSYGDCYEDDNNIQSIDKKSIWYKSVSEYDGDWDNVEYISDDIITKDFNGNQILDIFSLYAYEVVDEYGSGELFLHEQDANIFEIEIERKKYRVIDYFTYYKQIEENAGGLTLFRDKPLITIEQITNELQELVDENRYDTDSLNRLAFIELYISKEE